MPLPHGPFNLEDARIPRLTYTQKIIPYFIEVDERLESDAIELESIAGDGDKGALNIESV